MITHVIHQLVNDWLNALTMSNASKNMMKTNIYNTKQRYTYFKKRIKM